MTKNSSRLPRCSAKCPARHASVKRLLAALAEVLAACDQLTDEPEPKNDRLAMLACDDNEAARGVRWAAEVALGHVESNNLSCCHAARIIVAVDIG